MYISRSNWYEEFDNLQREMDRLMSHFAGAKPPTMYFTGGRWEPAIDVYETDAEFVIIADLAGVKEDDIEIMVERNLIRISGERDLELHDEKKSYHQMEIARGRFERIINLPVVIQGELTSASQHNGLLEIRLPKPEKVRVKKIDIKISEERGGK
ncbi:MAG: Hsp20/alpha crystallin family protein [Chloroflexi bacterium]|nr:Hsp20/alpha crystallin family protein [Chloroflexota bacterium]